MRGQYKSLGDHAGGDGAHRIFLNTKGENDREVSGELREFLHYVENTTDEMAARSGSERIRRIHARVCKVRASEEEGVKYMQAWEEKYYDRQEAREEGKEEGEVRFASLVERLIQDSRMDDLKKAAEDKTIREALYLEYGIEG